MAIDRSTTSRRPRGAQLVALAFDGEALLAIDQRELPWEERWLSLRTADDVADAIRTLAIRGAPLIGVAAAYGVALEVSRDPTPPALERACDLLRGARPTAANLAHAVELVRAAGLAAGGGRLADATLEAARELERAEAAASDAIAIAGAELLAARVTVLTHCNTGALAAPGRGTALAVIAELFERGQLDRVIATETRPLLQGARLTAYELARLEIPYELVVDGAAPGLIAAGEVEAVIVGCDRVAANGDCANKVGTYPLALAASAAGIAFVVAAPTTTIDLACATGNEIVIEERNPDEVRSAGGALLTLPGAPARNPAFDVTPAALLTALVTERGVARPVSQQSIAALKAA